MTPAFLLDAILVLMPTSPAATCLRQHRREIAREVQGAVARYPSVAPELLVAVGFRETHLGCVRGIGWGAPMRRRDRGHPGRAAARSLSRGLALCESRIGALRFFRTGRCASSPVGDAYASHTMTLIARFNDRNTAARVLHAVPSCARSIAQRR